MLDKMCLSLQVCRRCKYGKMNPGILHHYTLHVYTEHQECLTHLTHGNISHTHELQVCPEPLAYIMAWIKCFFFSFKSRGIAPVLQRFIL